MFRTIVVILILFSLSGEVLATLITGRVTNLKNESLAFANVYIKGTSKGTTTNFEGYFRLEAPEGDCELIFRFIGYKMKVEKLFVSTTPINLNVQLQPENYTLAEIQIKADAEDPAYPIIRKAIEWRKFYLNQVEEFSCDVYIKGLQRLTKYPDKIFGFDVNLNEYIDTATGIVYLSESVSRYSFKKPDHVKEEMISSKVSGSNRAFSFNQASEMKFNFYENIMMIGELSQRGFISPISQSGMFYYKYRLDGSFFENEKWVNRIEVIPKRKNDPVFAGYIYIQDSTWRIHSTDLYITKDAQIEFVDTLRIGHVYIPVSNNDDVWMMGSATFNFFFNAFGFEGNGSFVGVFSGYEIEPGLEKKNYRGSVMKINDDANKKDSGYWESIRPIPLTLEEALDYEKRDSLLVIKESKPYLDSLDKVLNNFKPANLITGYTYRNRYYKTETSISSLLENVQFNTVEGLNIGLGLGFVKSYENRKSWETRLNVRYGFSIERLMSSASIRYNYNIRKFAYVILEGGDDLVQFNQSNPISPIINTSYSLFGEKNYMKLFNKQYLAINSRIEPLNGIRLRGGVEYAVRNAVTNSTDFTFTDKSSRAYSSNNPLNPSSDSLMFETNEAVRINLVARFRFRQKYTDRPDVIYIHGSKYPALFVGYHKGINNIAGSDVDYDRMEVGVEDRIRLGMLGIFNYYGVYGKFLNTNKMYFMDFMHFNGNQTFLSGFEPRRFDLLEYYKYSTRNEYIQAFAEHEFGGFILNKIPGIRKLKLTEVVGFRVLHVPNAIDHLEWSFGIQKLGFIRADFVMSFNDKGKANTGFVVGLKSVIGR